MQPIHRTAAKSALRNSGFSLVEVLVALLIGLVAMLVMTQVFSWSEAQRRTTTGGGDAHSNGAIAMHGLQREIGLAGHGISATNLLGCNLNLGALTLNGLAPVTINHASIPAGDANTDTLLIVYNNASGSPEGDGITAQPGATQYSVQTPSSFAIGNLVIATPQVRAATCNLTLTSVTAVTAPNVTVASGVAGMANGTLFNMGTLLAMQAYAIRNGNLTMCDLNASDCFAAGNVNNAAIWIPIANNIVSLRAQYGRDSTGTMDGTVDIYDQDNTTLTTQCAWARVSAVRLALVARSGQFEKGDVTNASPTWAGSVVDNPTGSAAAPIDISKKPDGSANPPWKKFRYKLIETVVPIRNMAWMGVPSGC